MKKIIGIKNLALIVALLIAVTGCAQKTTTQDSYPESTDQSQIQSDATTVESGTDSAEGKNSDLITLNIGYPIGGIDFIDGIAGVAKEKGFLDAELEKAGYKINYIGFSGAGPAVNEALAGGKIDFALYADFPGIVITSKGVKTTLLSVITGEIHAGLLVANDSSITTIADLKGKKIAFPKGTFIQKYLLQALAANNISESDVELINMTTDAESALLSGNVDAIAYTEGIISLLQDKGNGKILHTSKENTDWAGAIVLIANTDYIQKNREAGVAFLKALVEARTYADSNAEEIYALFSEKTTLSLEAAKSVYGREDGTFDYYSLDLSEASLTKLHNDKQFLLDLGLIQDDFDVTTWGDPTIYEDALK